MRKKHEFLSKPYYHNTSRINHKTPVFSIDLGRKIMFQVKQQAKVKYYIWLANYCVIPTHIYLLVKLENAAV